MRFGIDIAYTHPRHHDLIEALVHNLSGALMPHQPSHSYNNYHPITFEAFELELGRAITAHNETPWRHQLRSPRELLYDQNMACT
jgi:hypothetical protein